MLMNLKRVYSSTGFVVNSVTGTGFSPSTSVFHSHYHSTNAPYSSTRCSDQKTKGSKPGNLPERNVLSEIVGHLFIHRGLNIFYCCIPTKIVLGETPFATLPVCTVPSFNKDVGGRYKTLHYVDSNGFLKALI
jgi:hypothetical protein